MKSVFHCFWECPKWDDLRLRFDLPCSRVRAAWPPCTSECGIFIEDIRVLGLVEQLEQEQHILADIDGYFHCSESRALIVSGTGSSSAQVLWTDGA